jgi:hypothetical protein
MIRQTGRDEVRARVAASERVRSVMAAAIIRAVWTREHMEVPWQQALRLAELGSIEQVLYRLREQRKIRRFVPGIRSTPEFRDKLVLAEVVADVTGVHGDDPSDRVAMIRQMLEREAAFQRAAAALEMVQCTIDDLFAELEIVGPRQREYARKASRLRSEQRARLQESIHDPDEFSRAAERLDSVYERHIAVAMAFTAPDSPPQSA